MKNEKSWLDEEREREKRNMDRIRGEFNLSGVEEVYGRDINQMSEKLSKISSIPAINNIIALPLHAEYIAADIIKI